MKDGKRVAPVYDSMQTGAAMNGFNFTKFFGAACAALAVFVVLDRGVDLLYQSRDIAAPVYPLPADPEEAVAAAPEAAPASLDELMAVADAGAGERAFKQCQACHRIDPGVNAVGPSMHAVVGRAVGSIADFRYSGALDGTSEIWSVEALFAFLENPRGYAPGTSMSFTGIRDAAERANLIAYLQTLSD